MTDTILVDWECWERDEPPVGFVDRVMDAALHAGADDPPVRSVRQPIFARKVALLSAAAIGVASLGAFAAVSLRQKSRTVPSPTIDPPSAIPSGVSPSNDARAVPPERAEPRRPVFAPGTVIDKKRRDEVKAALRPMLEAEGVRYDPKTGFTLPAGAPGPSHNLTHDYIQARVREDFFPLARSCYETALAKSPKLGGRVVVDFMIVGDAKVGGIVDQAKINDRTDIDDDEFKTCLRESMLSMVFAPPENDGWVTVTYPIVFAPGDDEEGRDH